MKYILIMITILAAGCGSGSNNGYGSGSGYYGGTTGSNASHLQDATNRSIYTYSMDTTGVSNCTATGGCIQAWPAVPAGTALNATMSGLVQNAAIGSITRTNPSGNQETYNGKPLYYFINDTAPGAVSGNGVSGFNLATP